MMFREKLLSGFGPGTYQFENIPYQLPALMNHLSVTNPYKIPKGFGGTAHSEYLPAPDPFWMGNGRFMKGVLRHKGFDLVFQPPEPGQIKPGAPNDEARLSTYRDLVFVVRFPERHGAWLTKYLSFKN